MFYIILFIYLVPEQIENGVKILAGNQLKIAYQADKADVFSSDETEIYVFIDRTSTRQRAWRPSKQTE